MLGPYALKKTDETEHLVCMRAWVLLTAHPFLGKDARIIKQVFFVPLFLCIKCFLVAESVTSTCKLCFHFFTRVIAYNLTSCIDFGLSNWFFSFSGCGRAFAQSEPFICPNF